MELKLEIRCPWAWPETRKHRIVYGHWQFETPRAASRSHAAWICSGVDELPVTIAHFAPAA